MSNEDLTTQLLAQLRAKRVEAKQKWDAAEKAKADAAQEAQNAGLDVVSYLNDGDRFDKMDGIYKEYSSVATEVQALEERFGKAASWNAKGPTQPDPEQPVESKQRERVASLGEQFISSPEYKSWKTGSHPSAGWTTGSVEIKATVTEAASPVIKQDWQSGLLPILFRRPTVDSLLAQGTTQSNVVRYLKETTATNAAAAVSEGGLKPESSLVFALVDEPVRKIATFLPVSDEMLEDESQIMSYLNQRLGLFLDLAEDDQLINGNGTAPNILGLLNRTGIQTQAKGANTDIDAIHKAITLIRLAFLEPDGIVMHPTEYEDIRLAKDANNQYFGGGPFTGAYGVNGIPNEGNMNGTPSAGVWGLRTVVTTAIDATHALVGAFGTAAQVFQRSGPTVEASNGYNDFFQRNLTAIRAEERLALAVYRPAAFCDVTGL